MKDKLTIRISDSLKIKLSEKSETEQVSVSEVARTILENYFSTDSSLEWQSKIEKSAQTIQEIVIKNPTDTAINFKEEDVVFSREFYKLLIWMYDKRESRKLKLSKYELDNFKNTLNKVQVSTEIPIELKREFDKVFVDLVGMLSSDYKFKSTPEFVYSYSRNSFNYKMLNEFLFPEKIIINLSNLKDFGYD